MTELMTRPVYEAEPYEPSSDDGEIVQGEVVDSLEESYDIPAAEAADESREVSPTGASLVRAANRVNDLLEKRAINNAHAEALQENQQRKVDAQNNAYASYEENIDVSAEQDEAYRMNDKIDARAARKERLEEAKDKVRGAGRRALGFLKNAGLITLGAGVLAGEYAAKKVKSGTETVTLGAMIAKDRVASAAETAALGAMIGTDKVKDGAKFAKDTVKVNATTAYEIGKYEVAEAVDRAKNKVSEAKDTVSEKYADVKQTAGDMIASVRERLRRRKEAALTRKYERHAKWNKLRSASKEFVGTFSRKKAAKTIGKKALFNY